MTRDSYLGNVMSPLTLNRYDYVGNNPVMNIDPSGHRSVAIATVEQFQQGQGIAVDGVVGRQTETALLAARAIARDVEEEKIQEEYSNSQSSSSITDKINERQKSANQDCYGFKGNGKQIIIKDFNNNVVYGIADYFKDDSTYQWVVEKTQDGEFPMFFDYVGFYRDENGVYHSKQDGWQSWKYVGYNRLYDMAFDSVSSMDYNISDFSANGEKFRLWLWKGDYLNLGAGAEVGIYYGGGLHWLTGTQYAMPMKLSMYDNEENKIFNWNPEENNWWITGFNPNYQNVEASNLTVYGTIDFSQDQQHLDMWDAFYEENNGKSMWTFDTENHIAKFKW